MQSDASQSQKSSQITAAKNSTLTKNQDTTTKRKSQRIADEVEDEEDSDYVHRERKDIQSNSSYEDEEDDCDSKFDGLEGREAREAYVKRKLDSGAEESNIVAKKHQLGKSREKRKRNRGKGLQKHTTAGISEPKTKSPASRIREFATEPFESNVQHPNKLFCTACLTVVSLKKKPLLITLKLKNIL